MHFGKAQKASKLEVFMLIKASKLDNLTPLNLATGFMAINASKLVTDSTYNLCT